MCSLSWKNVVAVIAVLTLQIAYSSGEKDTCTFEEYTEDPGHNNCCFYEPDCNTYTTCKPVPTYVWHPYNETIWNCRNFTRKIKECVVLPMKEEICKPFKEIICKAVELQGKCATVTHKKKCVNKCAPEFPLYNPEIHKQCEIEDGSLDKIDLRIPDFGRAGKAFVERPEDNPAPLGLANPPFTPHDKPHDPHDPDSGITDPDPIPEGCHESCEYETFTKCCDFPEEQCQEVWLEECIIRPKINCTWNEYETCFFTTEIITKYEKIPCIATEQCEYVCHDRWWCKECEHDKQCYKNKEDYQRKGLTQG
jgi:hypothetical protein